MSSNLNKYLQEDNHEPSQPTEAQTKRGQELARQYGLEAEPPGEKVPERARYQRISTPIPEKVDWLVSRIQEGEHLDILKRRITALFEAEERLGAAERRANESKMQDEAKAGYIQFICEGLHRLQKQFSDTRQDDEPGEAIEFIAGELGNVLQTMQERDDLEAERDRLKEALDGRMRVFQEDAAEIKQLRAKAAELKGRK